MARLERWAGLDDVAVLLGEDLDAAVVARDLVYFDHVVGIITGLGISLPRESEGVEVILVHDTVLGNEIVGRLVVEGTAQTTEAILEG